MLWSLMIFCILAWAVIFIVTELHMAQRGKDTWAWVVWLYNRFSILQRIRW